MRIRRRHEDSVSVDKAKANLSASSSDHHLFLCDSFRKCPVAPFVASPATLFVMIFIEVHFASKFKVLLSFFRSSEGGLPC